MVKHDVPVFNRSFSQVAEEFATMQRRRDEFILEEYRKLQSVGRKWMKEATTSQGIWYRQMCYNFILIMCNTGMRRASSIPHVRVFEPPCRWHPRW